jgi:hypothetical protein
MSTDTSNTSSAEVKGLRKNGENEHQLCAVERWASYATGYALMIFLHLGKQWRLPKTAFRPNAGLTSYSKRVEERKLQQAVKAKEKELKEEKEAKRQVS